MCGKQTVVSTLITGSLRPGGMGWKCENRSNAGTQGKDRRVKTIGEILNVAVACAKHLRSSSNCRSLYPRNNNTETYYWPACVLASDKKETTGLFYEIAKT